MTPPSTTQTSALHSEFNRLTRQAVRYDMSRHYCWEAWLAAGYTEDDLRLVIAYIWRRIKAGKRERESFKLSVLIGDLSKFEDDRAVAMSEAAVASKSRPMPSGRAAVLRSTGRSSEAPARPARTPAQVMAEHEEMAKLLREWRTAHL